MGTYTVLYNNGERVQVEAADQYAARHHDMDKSLLIGVAAVFGPDSRPMVRYEICVSDLGVEWADEGPWRNYELTAYGDTLEELINSAAISEIDQEGGELSTYELDDASSEVVSAALREIERCIYESALGQGQLGVGA